MISVTYRHTTTEVSENTTTYIPIWVRVSVFAWCVSCVVRLYVRVSTWAWLAQSLLPTLLGSARPAFVQLCPVLCWSWSRPGRQGEIPTSKNVLPCGRASLHLM